jgi:hypothetical protein
MDGDIKQICVALFLNTLYTIQCIEEKDGKEIKTLKYQNLFSFSTKYDTFIIIHQPKTLSLAGAGA